MTGPERAAAADQVADGDRGITEQGITENPIIVANATTDLTARREWAVRYRRAGWKSRQVRYFQTWQGARRYRAKLHTASEWAPIVDLTIERREVGPWENVDTWVQR